MVQVKICGITNLEDALEAVAAGAHALGFNFYRKSPRFIEPAIVREIVRRLPPDLLTVGVFVNEAGPETVARMADEGGVGAVQLHGDESPDYCRALAGRHVIKALRVGAGYRPEQALLYPVEAILLDAFDPATRGGTGQICDWTLARNTRELVPRLFLAGGLAPENVAEAIVAVGPYGVDAASGLEMFATTERWGSHARVRCRHEETNIHRLRRLNRLGAAQIQLQGHLVESVIQRSHFLVFEQDFD